MNFCSLFGGLRVGARRKGKWGKEMGAGRKFFCGEVKWTSLVLFRTASEMIVVSPYGVRARGARDQTEQFMSLISQPFLFSVGTMGTDNADESTDDF